MLKPSVGIYGVYEKSEEGWENAHSLISTVKENLSRARCWRLMKKSYESDFSIDFVDNIL